MKKVFLTIVYFCAVYMTFAQTLISVGSSWKYLDDGSNQGIAWQNLNYNESSWASSNAQLGYGDGDEVVRSNMLAGYITYNTFAASTVAGANEDTIFEYSVPSSVLNSEQNIVAVEVHQRSASSTDVSFDFKLEFNQVNFFEKLPYLLYVGVNDQMKIMWQLTNTQNCSLEYGTDTNYSDGTINTTEYNNDHQHKVILTGLTPDQKYYYRVSDTNGSVYTGNFQTGALDNISNLTFFAYGDTRSNPGDHDNVAEQVMFDIKQNNLKQTFIINTGDLVSNGDNESAWQNEFFNQQYTHITEMLANLPYVSALGNHEEQGILFKKFFEYPIFVNNDFYFSFDYGPVHVIIIDTEIPFSQGSKQYNWIVNDLSSSTKPWKVAAFHRPGWSAGVHSNNSSVQTYLQQLFEQYNVSFVINGHNHYYSRAEVNDVEHITTGGGGAPLYNPDNSYPNIVITDKSNHYCKLEISGDVLHFTAIRSDGSIIEEFDKQKVTTGIDSQMGKNDWQIYTDNSNIIVDTKDQEEGFLEVYDYLGRMISRKKIINNQTEFNIYQTGAYFIRNIYNAKFEVKKVVITN